MGWAIRSSLISIVQLKIIPLLEKLRNGVTTYSTPIFPAAALSDAWSSLSVPTRNLDHDGVYLISLIGGLPLLPLHTVFLCLSPSLVVPCLGLCQSNCLCAYACSLPSLSSRARFPRPALERKQPEAGGFLKIHCYFLATG